MGDPPRERLFRDEAGAALERVAELSRENAELRAEIERLKRAGEDARRPSEHGRDPAEGFAVPVGSRRAISVATMAMVTAAAVVGALTVVCEHTRAPRRPRRAVAIPAPTTFMMPADPAATPEYAGLRSIKPGSRSPGYANPGSTNPGYAAPVSPRPVADDCATPFVIDDNGFRRMKPRCLSGR